MEQVYLKDIRKEILAKIAEAKESISLAMAWFTNPQLLSALLSSLKRGVNIEVIILDDEINRNDSFGLDFQPFIEQGGKLYLFNPAEKLMHNKFCVIDRKYVITGSYNWTNYAEYRNLENIIITDNESVITSYQRGFEDIKAILLEEKSYKRIPASIITRESYMGNYNEYQLEYKYSCNEPLKVNNICEPKVIEVNNRQNPKSKYNIGFHAYINGNDNGMRILIPKDQELPYSIIKDSWLNQDNISQISCEIYYGDIDNSINGNSKLVTLPLQIPLKKKNELHFKTKVTMDTNAYLHIEFVCVETGKSMETTICKTELVNY